MFCSYLSQFSTVLAENWRVNPSGCGKGSPGKGTGSGSDTRGLPVPLPNDNLAINLVSGLLSLRFKAPLSRPITGSTMTSNCPWRSPTVAFDLLQGQRIL